MKPFHQVARYTTAQYVIEALRTQSSHTILEVGAGSHGNLAEYLPKDNITFLDPILTAEALRDPRFVQGDATKLEYPDDHFDFVIGLDVLEHIEPNQRSDFLANICRVAKLGVFLTFPHFSAAHPNSDEEVRSFYIAAGGIPPVWIDEHIDCTLPDAVQVKNEFSKYLNEGAVYHLYGVNRELMRKMLCVEAAASQYPEFAQYFRAMNDTYCRSLVYYDLGGDQDSAIKSYMIGSKCMTSDMIEKKVEKYFLENHELIKSFETDVGEQASWYFQLQSLAYAKRSEQFAHQAFDVLNGRTQASIGQLSANMDSSFQQIRQELVNARTAYVDETKELKWLLEENRVAELEYFQQANNGVATILQKMTKLVPDKAVLDIILITYNQSRFIEETVQSLLSQKVNFPYRILVADDCSKDDTVEKIKRLAEGSDVPFVFLPNDHNLGIMHNYQRAFAACTAEFVAILEGDDIWTDPLRLQMHVDFLRAHSECSMSFNRYVVKNFEEGTFHMQPRFSADEEKLPFRYVSGHDLAYDNLIGNFSTSVYRNSSLKALPQQLFDMKAYDWLTNILVSRMGFVGCLMQPTSIYRIHANGVWSGQDRKEQLTGLIATIDEYNRYTNYEFTGGFSAHRERLVYELGILEAQEKIEEVIPRSNVTGIKTTIKTFLRKVARCRNYLPPVCTSIVKLLLPQVVQERLRRICGSSES